MPSKPRFSKPKTSEPQPTRGASSQPASSPLASSQPDPCRPDALPRVYLDNAATSYPKPPAVWDAMDRFSREIGASAGRGAYAEAFECGRLLQQTRDRLAALFNAPDPTRFLFTLNASGALNLALKGILNPGDHVVTSAIEHNSILRPLNALQERGTISFTKVACAPTGELDPDDVARAIRPNTRLIAMLHGSNVSGVIFPIAELARMAREYEIPFLVDAAQTAGSCPIDVQALDLDMVAFPGHKGLLGPLGTGALWVRQGVSLRTVTEGGTGSISEQEVQPDFWPDRHEAGSHNAVGLVGLGEGVQYLLDRGVDDVRAHKETLVAEAIRRFEAIDGVTLFGPRDPALNAGVVSIRVAGWTPNEFAVELDRRYRINVRPGLHCAPGAHQTIGSLPEGTIRFSLGPFNTADHIRLAAEAVDAMARERLAAGRTKG